MEADFSGYATKAGLKCSDGRTILPDAFKHQDTMQVPLVWQHNHDDPENVLGHAILENREDGVYCYGFFNNSKKAVHAREMVEHKDITAMSIWANDLIERAKRVLHGAIREVSLVLSGANPGAVIDNVTIRHSDGDVETLENEAIIYSGLSFDQIDDPADAKHAVSGTDNLKTDTSGDGGSGNSDSGETVQDIYDGFSDKQREVVHYLIGEAMASSSADNSGDNSGAASHDNVGDGDNKDKTVTHENVGKGDDDTVNHNQKGNNEMETKKNVFENTGTGGDPKHVISHDDMMSIVKDATRSGSLKDAVEGYALAHGIENIDTLFPEAAALDAQPQFLSRRVEWVNALLSAVRKSPFSRIKTLTADITMEDARAKGYVKGNLKKEEFFDVVRRVTTPTTIYKKQAIDRDDVVDITDFDVVVWLKGEMRLMLDEELARAILMGDGRDSASEDKINEGNIRPIAKEHELFASTITVNLGDANSSISEVTDAFIAGRWQYKGTGTPTMFASESLISKYLLLRDTLGRRIYSSIDDVANELRVSSIVPVEAMESDPTLLAIIVNPVDYVVGATAGGQVSLFDFFDIDYNKQKYLIETRCSGALTRLKSAIIIRRAGDADTAVAPTSPTYDPATGVVTIPTVVGVTYQNADTGAVMAPGDQAPLAVGQAVNIIALASGAHYIPSTEDDHWHFVKEA